MKTAIGFSQRGQCGLARPVMGRKQSGVVLVIALIVLVAMTLASIAVVRSIDTSTLVAGNLAFKQSGIASGDAGVNAAITWLEANGASLTADAPANGYYATSQYCVDLTGNGSLPSTECPAPTTVLDWSNTSAVKSLTKDAAGNKVSYVIHRLCDEAGALNGSKCRVEESNLEGDTKSGLQQSQGYRPMPTGTVDPRGYYRITVRIDGPKNNVSYVQAVVSR